MAATFTKYGRKGPMATKEGLKGALKQAPNPKKKTAPPPPAKKQAPPSQKKTSASPVPKPKKKPTPPAKKKTPVGGSDTSAKRTGRLAPSKFTRRGVEGSTIPAGNLKSQKYTSEDVRLSQRLDPQKLYNAQRNIYQSESDRKNSYKKYARAEGAATGVPWYQRYKNVAESRKKMQTRGKDLTALYKKYKGQMK